MEAARDAASPSILARPDGATIAYRRSPGKAPGVVFCAGFRSDMTGTKALFLEDYCRRHGHAYVRFDYFAHGRSSGDFALGTIGRWAEDAVAVIDSLTEGPQILVGSSMGGWIMLLAAMARPARVAALVASEVVLHPAAQLREVSGPGGPAARVPAPERVVTCHYTGARQMRVSEEMFGFLSRVRRAPSPLAALGAKAAEALAGELMGLWEQRFIDVLPADG